MMLGNNRGCWWSVKVEVRGRLSYTLQWMGKKGVPMVLMGMVERDKGKMGVVKRGKKG